MRVFTISTAEISCAFKQGHNHLRLFGCPGPFGTSGISPGAVYWGVYK